MGESITGSFRCTGSLCPAGRYHRVTGVPANIKSIHLLLSTINRRRDYPHFTDHLLEKQFVKGMLQEKRARRGKSPAPCSGWHHAMPLAWSPVLESAAPSLTALLIQRYSLFTPGRREFSVCCGVKRGCSKHSVSSSSSHQPPELLW